MEDVIAYIDRRTLELQRHPFLGWLSDESISAQERLSAWLPGAAFFVFGFMDLNGAVLKYPEAEAAADPLKKAINDHVAEDSNHWGWYLSDLRKLGLDRTMKFSEVLRFLWSEENRQQRLATYQFCVLAARAKDPVIRYALLAALEAYAHLLFGTLVGVSAAYEDQTGTKLAYLGPIHFEREPGHLANQHDDTEDVLRQCTLDEERRAIAMEVAGEVCDLIDARWHEFHRHALSSQNQAVGAAV